MTSLDRDHLSNALEPHAAKAWMRDLGKALQPAAERYARKLGGAAKPALNHVRRHPVPYALGALTLGAVIGLAMSRKARNTVGDSLSRAWDLAGDSDLLAKLRRH